MQTITIDTHEAIEALRAEKFSKEQAKAIVDTIRNVELYGVATSEDIRRLEEKIQNLSENTSDDIRRLEEKITQQGTDLSERIHRVEIQVSDFKSEVSGFKSEIFKWGGSLIAGVYALLVGVLLVLLKLAGAF